MNRRKTLKGEIVSEYGIKDFRGNEYALAEKIGRPCQHPGCPREAVRLPCVAEGDFGRTHWHGLIHTCEGGLGAFCLEHGQTESKKWTENQ